MPDMLYPCDAGTGQPVGFHKFEAGPSGIVCCTLCGAMPGGTVRTVMVYDTGTAGIRPGHYIPGHSYTPGEAPRG